MISQAKSKHPNQSTSQAKAKYPNQSISQTKYPKQKAIKHKISKIQPKYERTKAKIQGKTIKMSRK